MIKKMKKACGQINKMSKNVRAVMNVFHKTVNNIILWDVN
jgi:hypothetical protein